ncbi:hypothetical protein LTR62_007879 [Meristemomyces frigidus]|uniref:Uncharacterized protein n=1 Tax=Meristemomyces frigidus TaxID=1508187 RepID=A0AAN7TA89_9PEZI|nr:hypothetical protein LTR62_007879 [Meristemomyces frigidus]
MEDSLPVQQHTTKTRYLLDPPQTLIPLALEHPPLRPPSPHPPSQSPPLKILIIGTAIAGFVLATLLLLLHSSQPAEKNSHITLLERLPVPLRDKGEGSDIRGVGVDVIRKLGQETAIRASTTGEEGVRIVDERDGVWAEFGVDRTRAAQTGTSDITILRGRLARICL